MSASLGLWVGALLAGNAIIYLRERWTASHFSTPTVGGSSVRGVVTLADDLNAPKYTIVEILDGGRTFRLEDRSSKERFTVSRRDAFHVIPDDNGDLHMKRFE